MSGYLVTSPYGPLPYHAWMCGGCPAGGGGLGTGREDARAGASAHIAESGHDVTLIDGTSERLLPVATTAESGARP